MPPSFAMSPSLPRPLSRDVGGLHVPHHHHVTTVNSPPAMSVTTHNTAMSLATMPTVKCCMGANKESCEEEGRGCKDTMGVGREGDEGEGWTQMTMPMVGHAGTETRGNARGRRIPIASTRGSVQPTHCPSRAPLLSTMRQHEAHMPPCLFPPPSLSSSDDGRAV